MSEPTSASDLPFSSLNDIRQLVIALPGGEQDPAAQARERDSRLTKPPRALGRLEDLAVWLAEWQGSYPPRMSRPMTCVFAGNHGVTARGVSAYPTEVTGQMVQNFVKGGSAVNQLCRTFDAGLQVFEMSLDEPTADFTGAPAMTEEECLTAIGFGMRTLDTSIDVLCLGEMGIGNTTSGAAMAAALFGRDPADWVGRGAGVDDDGLERKRAAVAEALAFHGNALDDPLEVLRRLGGHELAAIVGAIIGARVLRVPVLLDGYTCTAAAAVLARISDRALDHCEVAHLSREPGHRLLCDAIGKRPLLDLGMALGEGSGATLAVGILQAAVSAHNGMATFDEAGVSNRKD